LTLRSFRIKLILFIFLWFLQIFIGVGEMARPLRVEYPNAFYHAISRGNGGQLIFQTDRDKEKFLAILQKAVDRYSLPRPT
jgi:hypothetical protein